MGEDTKFYEVIVTASVQILVQASSEEEAVSVAYEEVDFDNASVKDVTSEGELSSEEEIERLERHADQKIYM